MSPSSFPVLNASTLNDYVVIYPNYRVNAFGFLPGKAIKESPTSDLNPDLLDQQFVLKWVQSHIHLFGGDPKSVTIWGQSAGAGSLVGQALANGRNGQPKLFSKALASSPFWPKTYDYNSPEAIFEQFVNLTGCARSSDHEMVSCLKTVDVQTIRGANLVILAGHTWTFSSYTWAPVIDGVFLVDTLTEAVKAGSLETENIWGMYNTHEEENFVPSGLKSEIDASGFNSSGASFHAWLKGFLPGFSERLIRAVEEYYYHAIGSTETVDQYNSTYLRAGLAYRDVFLTCPAYWVANGAERKGYLGEYTISPATHGSDTIFWNRINAVQTTNPVVYEGYAGTFASFIQTGDPNAHKLTDDSQPGVPVLQRTGKEFVVVDEGFENTRLAELKERRDFWKNMGKHVPV